jgi:uncharacterized membrane protein
MSSSAIATPAAAPLPARQPSRVRLDSVDMLRGLVMVIMALDHTRDYFTAVRFNPTDLTQTTAALFLTRWITHFCAPVFVFLAGTGAFLSVARGKTRRELAWFLVTRGLWLVVLEVTVVRFAWAFNLDYSSGVFIQVIWALGVSMIALAALIVLPRAAITGIGLLMVLGHNLLDSVQPAAFGSAGWLWTILHVQAPIALAGYPVFVAYPLIPWIGVMALGYTFGPLLLRPEAERRRLLLRLGGAMTLAFFVVRSLNFYGDPGPWSGQPSLLYTMLSFLNTTKYPPSLSFLLMTLGPSIMALAWFEQLRGAVARFLIVFGRVPLFFYILHLLLIHALALVVGLLLGYDARQFMVDWVQGLPGDWGFGLGVVYLMWALVVLALYPVCRWFAGVKARRRDAWLSYL